MSVEPTTRCASCNEPGHARRTFRGCRFNPRNQTAPSEVYIEIEQLDPSRQQNRCASCNELGHSRRTSSLCRLNPVNFNNVDTDMSNDVDVDMEENDSDNTDIDTEIEEGDDGMDIDDDSEEEEDSSEMGDEEEDDVCMHCNRPGHLRRTSLLCPLNPRCTRNIAKIPERVPTERDERGSMNVVCSNCSALMWVEERAANTSKSNPGFQLCCSQGNAVITSLKPTPPEIATLLRGDSDTTKEFKKNIRSYNSSLSFTSFGVNLDMSLANNRVGS